MRKRTLIVVPALLAIVFYWRPIMTDQKGAPAPHTAGESAQPAPAAPGQAPDSQKQRDKEKDKEKEKEKGQAVS